LIPASRNSCGSSFCPANKAQLPRNAMFEPLWLDTDFQRIFN
jgi:hypothetical protein